MISHKYVYGSWKGDLCIREKVIIARADPNTLPNKHGEIVSRCWYRNKLTLRPFKNI